MAEQEPVTSPPAEEAASTEDKPAAVETPAAEETAEETPAAEDKPAVEETKEEEPPAESKKETPAVSLLALFLHLQEVANFNLAFQTMASLACFQLPTLH